MAVPWGSVIRGVPGGQREGGGRDPGQAGAPKGISTGITADEAGSVCPDVLPAGLTGL